MKSKTHSAKSRLTIWDIPKLSVEDLKRLLAEVPPDVLELAILDVNAEIRNKIYGALSADAKNALHSQYTARKSNIHNNQALLDDVLHAQERISKIMAGLF